MIPQIPKNAHDPRRAEEILVCAESWLAHADRLVYSYGSRTFLSGYDLYEPGGPEAGRSEAGSADSAGNAGRGHIDCSTLVLLVLAGISYEESPYALGSVERFLTLQGLTGHGGPGRTTGSGARIDPELLDFSALPDRYVGIAERIGRPYLAGPKGIDLAKAAELGIDHETIGREIRATGTRRRSAQLADYYRERGDCFSDPAAVLPGDLVFYRSAGYFTEGRQKFPAKAEVNHVGIIARDPSMMINSTGLDPDGAAVSLLPVFGRREPACFARAGAEKENVLGTKNRRNRQENV